MSRTVAGTEVGSGAEGKEPIFTWPFVNLMMANGALRFSTFMLVTLVPLYVLQTGGGPVVAGLTATLYMGAAVILRPFAGRLVDTRGRYIVMIVGAVLYAVGTGLYIVTLPIGLFLVVRAIQGAGFSLNGTAVMTVATDLIPEKRMAEGIGYLGLEATLAQVLGPSAALLLSQTAGYRVAFAVCFGFALLTVLLRFPLRKRLIRLDKERLERAALREQERVDSGAPVERSPFWHRLVDRDAWRPALIIFLVMVGSTSVNTFLSAYALGRGFGEVGWFFVISGLAITATRLLVGRAERRFGISLTIGSGITLIIAAMILLAWLPNVPVLFLAGLLFGSGMGTVQPGISALAVLVAHKENRGMANTTVFLAMDLSQALIAVPLGAIVGVLGSGAAFGSAAIVLAVALVVFIALERAGAFKHRTQAPS